MEREETNMMTVKELKSILAEYDDEQIVTIWGGEDGNGGFGCLAVCDNEDDAIFNNGTIIMEYED